jgi:hypothetical protein
MELILNNDEKFDFSLREFKIKFPTDGVYHPAELNAYEILQKIVDGKVEIKDHNKSMDTGNLFIEFKIDNKGDGKLVQSGLRTTEADYWLFNIGTGLIIVETNFLKHCFNNRKIFGLRTADNSKYETNHIGYGLLIPISRLTTLLKIYQDFINLKQ